MNQLTYQLLDYHLENLNKSIRKIHTTTKVHITLNQFPKYGVAEVVYNEKFYRNIENKENVQIIIGTVDTKYVLNVVNNIPWVQEIIYTWLYDIQACLIKD
jgi:phosphotransferase system IIB component